MIPNATPSGIRKAATSCVLCSRERRQDSRIDRRAVRQERADRIFEARAFDIALGDADHVVTAEQRCGRADLRRQQSDHGIAPGGHQVLGTDVEVLDIEAVAHVDQSPTANGSSEPARTCTISKRPVRKSRSTSLPTNTISGCGGAVQALGTGTSGNVPGVVSGPVGASRRRAAGRRAGGHRTVGDAGLLRRRFGRSDQQRRQRRHRQEGRREQPAHAARVPEQPRHPAAPPSLSPPELSASNAAPGRLTQTEPGFQRPSKRGGRLARKAVTASRLSAVPRLTVCDDALVVERFFERDVERVVEQALRHRQRDRRVRRRARRPSRRRTRRAPPRATRG